MKRHQLSPGITYASRSTLSVIGQPVVGRGAQSLGHIKEEASTVKSSTSSSSLSAAEITERVRAAVSDCRIEILPSFPLPSTPRAHGTADMGAP